MANNPNPFAGMARSMFGGATRRATGTRAAGATGGANPYSQLGGAMRGLPANANPFATPSPSAPGPSAGGGLPGGGAVNNPYAGGGAGGGMGGGMGGAGFPGGAGGMGGAGGGGGLAEGSAYTPSSDDPYDMWYRPDPYYFASGGTWEQAFAPQIAEAAANNPWEPDRKLNPHAWKYATAGRGYPETVSGGQTNDGWWVTPDGMGPNGEFGFYEAGANGLMDGYGHDQYAAENNETAEQILEHFPEQMKAIAAAGDEAIQSLLNNPSHPIWQHMDPEDFSAAIEAINNGALDGGGTGGAGGTGGKGPAPINEDTSKRPGGGGGGNGGGGGGGGGKTNASGGKKGDHKNTGPGGGRDTKGGGGGGKNNKKK
jgi:hypothetical protein